MQRTAIIFVFGVCGLAVQATAFEFFNEDVSINDQLCVGFECGDNETFGGFDTIKLSENNIQIRFEDTSPSSGSFPFADWRIWINDTSNGGDNYFAIEDASTDTFPFKIRNNAPTHSLVVGPGNGFIGLGTSMPTGPLHLVRFDPFIRLQDTIANRTWDIKAGNNFFIKNAVSGDVPFHIGGSPPTGSLKIDGRGNVGIGTFTPDAPLELFSDDGFNYMRITANGAAVNESVDITYTGGPSGTGQLRYNIVDGDNHEMSLDADGNVVLDGTLTTAGGTCGSGCDRVFEAGYDLPSIADHAGQMFAKGYLPNVGPTPENTPINVSDKLGRMLNALEYAHIYIAQQDERMAAYETQIAELTARLDALSQ